MNLRELPGYHALAEAIEERAGQSTFAYFPNPGNWGDGLIHAGTVQFLDQHSFEYQTYGRAELDGIDGKKFPLAIVGGGGGWCRNWGSTPKFLEQVAAKFDQVVLLPTSFEPGIAEQSLPNVLYFSRDLNGASDDVLHCPDMAFYVDFPAIEPSLGYPLLAFRRDKERHESAVAPFRNWDLSLLGRAQDEVESLIRLVAKFRVVYTDRLHLGITAAMLGRQTFLLDGNYSKNQGVFEATIESHLVNARFLTWEELIVKNPSGFTDPELATRKQTTGSA